MPPPTLPLVVIGNQLLSSSSSFFFSSSSFSSSYIYVPSGGLSKLHARAFKSPATIQFPEKGKFWFFYQSLFLFRHVNSAEHQKCVGMWSREKKASFWYGRRRFARTIWQIVPTAKKILKKSAHPHFLRATKSGSLESFFWQAEKLFFSPR